jgi:hypothetical protein
VRKILSASIMAVCALGVLGLFGCSNGLVQSGIQPTNQPAPTQPAAEHQNGIMQDWSMHQTVYPLVGPIDRLTALQHDPRAQLSWAEAARARQPVRYPNVVERVVHQDWNISLGAGTTAPTMYPAKFSFNVNATPDCTNDFVIFTVNTTTGATQPNIVGFNNLYSGTTPTNGICNRTPNPPTDDGVSAKVSWSYNVIAADGQVSTSPSLSLDGTKVVFVETGSGTTAHLHVLAPSPGDGVNFSNLQDALTATATTDAAFGFATFAPVAGSGNATDLALVPTSGTASDTLSSPFVDFAHDVAYIGNDSGTLFRIRDIFCTSGACIAAQGAMSATSLPSLDPSWGTGGALATGCSGELTGAVVDGGTGNIFVGCSDGKLYGFTSGGSPLTGSPLAVGDGTTTVNGNVGGIVDPPMVDAVNGFVYVESGSSGGSAVLVQAGTTSFTSPTPVIATLGSGGHFKLHAPSFNAAYFSGGTALIYDWALNAGDTGITLYGVGFTGHTMNGGTPPLANQFSVGSSTPVEFSPTTELLNGATDQLFVSGLANVNPNFIMENINAIPSSITAATAEGSGTTGIVVDDVSGSAQASSIYFGVLGPGTNANTAVKVTQSTLQ